MHLAGGTLVRRLTQDASLAPAPETNPAALTTKTKTLFAPTKIFCTTSLIPMKNVRTFGATGFMVTIQT